MLCGVDLNFPQADFFRSSVSATTYILGLGAIQALVETLYLGLIYPRDEHVPRWCSLLGSRRIPMFLPLVLEGIGNTLFYRTSATLIIRFGSIWLDLTDGRIPADGMNDWWVAILVATYTPMLLLWAPALAIGLISYWRRRTTR